MKTALIVAGSLVALAAAGLTWPFWGQPSEPSAARADAGGEVALDVEAAQQVLAAGRTERALEMAQELLAKDANHAGALLVAAECHTKQFRFSEALGCYQAIFKSDAGSRQQHKIAYHCAGELALRQGDVETAERYFQEALDRDPYYPPAHNRLAFLYGLEGRRWEAIPHLVELIKQDEFSTFHLLLLANPKKNIVVDSFLDNAKAFDPRCPLPWIPETKRAIILGRFEQAGEMVGKLVSFGGEYTEIKMLEGRYYVLKGDRTEFIEWAEGLTLAEEAHPACWTLQAKLARHEGKERVAIRCYTEAFFRDPNNLAACQALSLLLPKYDEDPEIVKYFQARTALLHKLVECSHTIYLDRTNIKAMEEAFACCDWLERYWEAWGWCRAALEINPNCQWAAREEAEIEPQLVYDLPQTVIFRNINRWNYQKYPLPDWHPNGSTKTPQQRFAESSISFKTIGKESGLDFTYDSGHVGDPDDPKVGLQMFEVPGGGVAAVDYDLDLYPDLYFTQGSNKFNNKDDVLRDRFFRNLSGERFVDVTAKTGINETGYSQGVNAGDINNDGFPDLFVGNLGQNSLYLNNGDGTFTNRTEALPDVPAVWTTSTAIADLNRDGYPDLYAANYLAEEAYHEMCETEGYLRACNPRIFAAEVDKLILSQGNGIFVDAPKSLPKTATDSRSLGIVIADFFQRGQIDIFIASDMTANNLYVRKDDAQTFALRDEALVRGVALDQRGRAQSGMGVAFGDFDGNQQFDLFVTNFYGDYNTLYLQDQGAFADLSHSANVAALSYQYLGFGTQALDADLDGDLDLFVANGHIDDFRFQGTPYRMPPQLYVNNEGNEFVEQKPGTLGPYFSQKLLGRGVALLDWNRDGREDIVISHLARPAALISNTTEGIGSALRLSFVGRDGARDAVGTIIEVTTGADVQIGQVTAGSGYQASNEPILHFTIPPGAAPTVHVRWPDGSESRYANLSAGSHYVLVEDSPRPYLMPE